MERYNIFCTKNNLLHILNEYERLRLESENPEDLQTITQVYSLITNKSSFLTLGMTSEEFEELAKKNVILKSLIRRSNSNSNIILDYRPDFFEEESHVFTRIEPYSLLLLDSTNEKCEKLSEEYGLIFLCKDNLLQKSNFIFSWALCNVTKDTKAKRRFDKWEDIAIFQHPHNSLVLVDNYILNEDIEINLVPFLKNFLPQKLEKQIYDLTIITNNSKRDKSPYNLKTKYDSLSDALKILRATYTINLSIILIGTDDNHDRNIFTNYLWIHSGNSFNYFNRKNIVQNPTTLMAFSIFYQQKEFQSYYNSNTTNPISKCNTVLEAVEQLLKELKKHKEDSKNTSIEDSNNIIENAIGNKQNRLLE